ncbi:MAG: hypothetical protein ACFCVK_02115 [Acidimicrobiales bacterium]
MAARRRDPDDGRVYRISLTDAGAVAQRMIVAGRIGVARRVLERFTPSERAELGRLLPLMAAAVAEEFGVTPTARRGGPSRP